MQSYSQLSEFDLLLNFDLDLWPRSFKNESLPDLNIATNPWKFYHSTTKTVVRKLFTNKQTNKQASKQRWKQYLPNFVDGGNYGNLAYLVASTYGLNVIKIRGLWIFQGGRSLSALKRPEGVLTIIKSIWNYGNLAYLVANTYGLNVIKIGGIWIFQGGRSPLLRGLNVTCDAHFRTRISYSSQKSCVKIWFGLVEPFKSYHLNFPWGQKPPIRGVACDLQCPFSD